MCLKDCPEVGNPEGVLLRIVRNQRLRHMLHYETCVVCGPATMAILVTLQHFKCLGVYATLNFVRKSLR